MLCSVVQCTGNIILTYVVLLLEPLHAYMIVSWFVLCLVPLLIVVEPIAVTSVVHERLSSQVVERAEHYIWRRRKVRHER